MDFRQFFKPSFLKIVLTIILSITSYFIWMIGFGCAFGGSSALCVVASRFIYYPFLFGFIILSSTINLIPLLKFEFVNGFVFFGISSIFQLAWIYTLSCFIVERRKNKQLTKEVISYLKSLLKPVLITSFVIAFVKLLLVLFPFLKSQTMPITIKFTLKYSFSFFLLYFLDAFVVVYFIGFFISAIVKMIKTGKLK